MESGQAVDTSDVFGSVPENLISERNYEIDPNEFLEETDETTQNITDVAGLVFGPGTDENQIQDFEAEEDNRDAPLITLAEIIKSLETEMGSLGILYRKEWSTVIQRQFHKHEYEMRLSHIQMFTLGVVNERNLNIEKEIKDTSSHLTEEVNKLTGVSKGLADIKTKMTLDFDVKMKMFDHKMQEMEEMIKAVSKIQKPSIAEHSIVKAPNGVQDKAKDKHVERKSWDYNTLYLKLGFTEKHINHANMRKYGASMVTPDMYEIVMGDNALSEDLKYEYNQEIMRGIKNALNSAIPPVRQESRPSSSTSSNRYEVDI